MQPTRLRAIAEAAGGEVGFPSEPDAAGRKTKVPIRNAIRHFSRLMHTPAKAKRRLINLPSDVFQYPEPIHNLYNTIQAKEYKIPIISIL